MLKKLPLAAAIALCAAFPTAAYASGIGSAVGGAISAGGEIMDGAFDAGRDILNGFTADGTTNGGFGGTARIGEGEGDPDAVPGDTTNPDTTPGGTADPDATPGDAVDNGTDSGNTSDTTTSDTTSSDTTSDDLASGGNDSMTNSPNNPSTGATLGFTAAAAVLAAMGVMTTAVRRRDD